MTFLRPALLTLALLLPLVLAGAILLFVRRRRMVAAAMGDPNVVRRLIRADLSAVPWMRAATLLLAAVALGIAAAGPQWGRAGQAAEITGPDVVLLLDVSNSMLVEDAAGGASPSRTRLGQQRRAAEQITNGVETGRIGLVVFAGRAYVVSPLTADRSATEMFIEAAGPDIVQQTGTSLAAAIRQGTNLLALGDTLAPPRRMVLISDGDALEERAGVLGAARRAENADVQVYTLQTGTARGGPVPDIDFATGERLGYKTDPETGRTAISAANDQLLREIAEITGGRYASLNDPGAVSDLIRKMREDSGRMAGPQRGDRRPDYAWFVAAALVLLALDAVRDVRGRERAAP